MNAPLPFHSAAKTMDLAVQSRGLRTVLNGAPIEPTLGKRLEQAGLIENTAAGWILTEQGKFALAFAAAR
jgi:ribosomal protein S19E (S16A)